MSYSKISYSSRVHRTDIKYEHIIRSKRGLSMANDTKPDAQQDNRLRLQLAAIDRQKMQILRKFGNERTRALPRIMSRSKDPAFTQDRLNKTLKKYGMELPQLTKSQTAPDLFRSRDGVKDSGMTPRQWLAKTMRCPAKKMYSVLYEPDSYSAFCDRLTPLHEQNKAMKADIQTKISGRAVKDMILSKSPEESADSSTTHSSPHSSLTTLDLQSDGAAASLRDCPTASLRDHSTGVSLRGSSAVTLREGRAVCLRESPAVCLRYCDDMSLYLLEQSRLYNCSVTREEGEDLHNWEAYRRSCPVGNVTFVKGPDIVQLSYLAFHWFVSVCSFVCVLVWVCFRVCLRGSVRVDVIVCHSLLRLLYGK